MRKPRASDKEESVYLGYLLHNLYSSLEDFFLEITRTFENRIEDPARFHRELLKRMLLDIPQTRPRVLSKEGFEVLDELRGFRHMFRHSYDYQLSAEKVEALRQRVLAAWKLVERDLGLFETFLKKYLEDRSS